MGWIKAKCKEAGSLEPVPCLINTDQVCYVRPLLNGYTEFVFANEHVRHCDASIENIEEAIVRSFRGQKKFET